ncbi:hypothetical protein GF371_01390 [Candidatus Woesearchaeota archaeon]|nr:hypothetical protein [Candidatus Woesearchaeota archaeon]
MIKSKDTALAEITLRKYERPFKIKNRDLVSKFCLSVGLLQPGDSRDVVVDVLYALLLKKELNSKQIEEEVKKIRKRHRLPMTGVASSNLRRQVRRLRELFLIEKVATNYRIMEKEKFSNIYKEKIESFLLKSIRERVGEYFSEIDKQFLTKKPRKKRK